MVRETQWRSGVLTYNLLNDFRGLSGLLAAESEGLPSGDGDAFTPFLLAAGLHQILEDYLHRTPSLLGRAQARLGTTDHPLARLAGLAASGVAHLESRGRMTMLRRRGLLDRRDDLTRLLQTLAAMVATDGGEGAHEEARRYWARLGTELDALPESLLKAVTRVPNPFANFDLLPADCGALIGSFTRDWPDRERPILLVGVRTSGTYLAPLYQALLRAEGYLSVDMITFRPGEFLLAEEIARFRSHRARRTLTLVVDDPPAGGRVVGTVAKACIRYGAEPDSIVLVLPLLTPVESLPEALRAYHSVLLPWREWAIHQRLAPHSVSRDLTALLSGCELRRSDNEIVRVAAVRQVERVDPQADAGSGHRGHTSAVYRVRLVGHGGEEFDHEISARGAGSGYFAGYSCAVAAALAEFVPAVYGYRDGVVYEEWPGESRRLAPAEADAPDRVAKYVLARRQRLPVDLDLARRVVDQYGSWDLVADMLGAALLGRLRMLAFPLTHAAGRRLLEFDHASVVDGNMAPPNWLTVPARGTLKAGYDQRGFANAARVSYDAHFDLAAAAASFDADELLVPDSPEGAAFSDRLLQAYASSCGEEPDPERWLVYQLLAGRFELVRLQGRLTSVELRSEERVARLLATERALAAAQQRYIAALYLSDISPPGDGDLCALDVDWVLETRWLDFPAITPAGAVALRALLAHGFRPLIATGRSLGEVRIRCRTYRLAGGVAEYGSVVYDHGSGRTLVQLRSDDLANLDRLRAVLREMPGVFLDPAYAYAVRALRISASGRRRALTDDVVADALAAAGVERSVQVIGGHLQTDFASASVDKGTGVKALAHALGNDGDVAHPLALAIGDDRPDLPALELAARPFAPANATAALRAEASDRIEVVGGRCAAGLLQAVGRFLGHDPRDCHVCAPKHLSARARLVTIPLSAADGPRRARVSRMADLAAVLLRERRHR